VDAVIADFVSRNLLKELLIAFVTEKFRISKDYFFKSGSVDALEIPGAAIWTRDLIGEVQHGDIS